MRPALLLLSASYAGRKDAAPSASPPLSTFAQRDLDSRRCYRQRRHRRGRPSANSKWGIIAASSLATGCTCSLPDALEERNFASLTF